MRLDEARAVIARLRPRIDEFVAARADLAELKADLAAGRPSRHGGLPEAKGLEARLFAIWSTSPRRGPGEGLRAAATRPARRARRRAGAVVLARGRREHRLVPPPRRRLRRPPADLTSGRDLIASGGSDAATGSRRDPLRRTRGRDGRGRPWLVVTTFNRGKSAWVHPQARHLVGERRNPADVALLSRSEWDAVVDTWAGAPWVVRDGLRCRSVERTVADTGAWLLAEGSLPDSGDRLHHPP
jgi:hypothetical protein